MALQPKDITEERLMGLCSALYYTLQVQKYVLETMSPRLTEDDPYKLHARREEMFKLINKADNQLQIYFLGD